MCAHLEKLRINCHLPVDDHLHKASRYFITETHHCQTVQNDECYKGKWA